jgi:hypothetical protein
MCHAACNALQKPWSRQQMRCTAVFEMALPPTEAAEKGSLSVSAAAAFPSQRAALLAPSLQLEQSKAYAARICTVCLGSFLGRLSLIRNIVFPSCRLPRAVCCTVVVAELETVSIKTQLSY